MTSLDRLRIALADAAIVPEIPPLSTAALDEVIDELTKKLRSAGADMPPRDRIQEALNEFWTNPKVETLGHARLVCFGVTIPVEQHHACILEDQVRLKALLSPSHGIDQWVDHPRVFRRCYRGLLWSYFAYPKDDPATPSHVIENWIYLRDYLKRRASRLTEGSVNPEWTNAVMEHIDVFSPQPCRRYAATVLEGQNDVLQSLRKHLDIEGDSWFFRELILAQIQYATTLSDSDFADKVTALLSLLGKIDVLRDRGLTLLLNRYARISGRPVNVGLRDRSVDWWRNPWLPSNANSWGGVDPTAKEMVADWLKSEFIQAFFERLSEDRQSDRRRANFWMKYVKSMNHVQFALKSVQQYERDKDFQVLLRKMEGLITPILEGPSNSTAFIMSIGDMIAVEFGNRGNAFYAYETKSRPFDLKMPVYLAKNVKNSLKHDRHELKLRHKDDEHGYARWEDRFTAELRGRFNVHPGDPASHTGRNAGRKAGAHTVSPSNPPRDGTRGTVGNGPVQGRAGFPFEMGRLKAFANARRFRVEDLTSKNGCLWVLADDHDPQVVKVLSSWDFRYKAGKGWWREKG